MSDETDEAYNNLLAMVIRNTVELTAVRMALTKFAARSEGVKIAEIQKEIDLRADDLLNQHLQTLDARSPQTARLLREQLSPWDERLFSEYIDETLRELGDDE